MHLITLKPAHITTLKEKLHINLQYTFQCSPSPRIELSQQCNVLLPQAAKLTIRITHEAKGSKFIWRPPRGHKRTNRGGGGGKLTNAVLCCSIDKRALFRGLLPPTTLTNTPSQLVNHSKEYAPRAGASTPRKLHIRV